MSAPSKKILIRKNPLNQQKKKKRIVIVNKDDKAEEVEVPINPNAWDETIGYQGQSNSNEINRHGYYLPPSTGRTITIRKPRDKPLYVDTRVPLPPPLTDSQQLAGRSLHEEGQDHLMNEATVRLPTISNLKERNDLLKEQQHDLYAKSITPCRIVRKFISSLGVDKVGSASDFTFDVSEPLKRITKIKFISVNLTYVVPPQPPTNAFVYLDSFPLFENPSYYETDLGKKYSAHLPLITGTIGSTINSFYAFPRDYFMYLTNAPSDTVNTFNIKLYKEEPTSIPGNIVDFTDVTYATLEVEFYMENLVF